MAIIFNQQSASFFSSAISLDEFNSQQLKESSDLVPLQGGSMTFRNWCFGGYRLAYNKLQQTKETVYQVKNDLDAVKIYFNKRGNIHINYQQLGRQYALKNWQYNMLYSAELDSHTAHMDTTSEMFSLQITKECFLRLTEEGNITLGDFGEKVINKQPDIFSEHWLPMNTGIDKCLHDILACPFTGDMKKLYLHSKAVELFVLFAGASQEVPEPARRDIERLYFARDYIIDNYMQPLSLTNLGKVTGLNEFKLKKGFKELFHTSVIDFLISYRLEQGMRLLADTDKHISEVAYEVGYASPAYFSKAFKKKYGVSPNKS